MRKKSPLSRAMNNSNYKWLMYFDKLMTIALACYKWEGLPDSIDERFLELGLFEYGHIVYFKDKFLGDLVLPANLIGGFSIYNVPNVRYVYAINGYRKRLNPTNSVIIYNNYLRKPTIGVVRMYVDQLVNLSDAINININAQKTPYLISTTQDNVLAMKNLYDRIEGNEPAMLVDKAGFNIDDIKILKTEAPYLADRMYLLFQNIYNEYLSYLGVENMGLSVIKSERLTAAEGVANEGNVETYRNSWLNARQQAANEINRMFGTNISVRFNTELPSMINASFYQGKMYTSDVSRGKNKRMFDNPPTESEVKNNE